MAFARLLGIIPCGWKREKYEGIGGRGAAQRAEVIAEGHSFFCAELGLRVR